MNTLEKRLVQIGRTHELHEEVVSSASEALIILCPFIKISALKSVLKGLSGGVELIVVGRWKLGDLVVGVSDLGVYPLLKEMGASFYVNSDIHLKMLIADKNTVLIGSSNITGKGLGYSSDYNEEAMAAIPFTGFIEGEAFRIIGDSTLMTDEIFEKISKEVSELEEVSKEFKESRETIKEAEDKFILPSPEEKLSVFDFPFNDSSFELLGKLNDGEALSDSEIHDLDLLGLGKSNLKEISKEVLSDAFKKTKCFQWQENNIPNEVQFGKYSKLLHDALEDVPPPYRKDVKVLVNNMFNWSNELSESHNIKKFAHSSSLIKNS